MEHRTPETARANRDTGEAERRLPGRAESSGREAATAGRLGTAEEQAAEATRRDERAEQRDLAAEARDRAAEGRDHEIARLEESVDGDRPALEGLIAEAKSLRLQAASDRAFAADDRRLAALDRAEAAQERVETLDALRSAHYDDLTGAHRRGFGEQVLSRQIEDAQRSGQSLVLVIVDIDGLKAVNDREGHLAGDEVLRDVVDAIRANIRPDEPVVRLGGDEFAFAVTGIDSAAMGERFAVIRADLARRPSRARFSVGAAEMRSGSDLSEMLRRADIALVEARIRRSRIRDLGR